LIFSVSPLLSEPTLLRESDVSTSMVSPESSPFRSIPILTMSFCPTLLMSVASEPTL
jgi:hypothetical protein